MKTWELRGATADGAGEAPLVRSQACEFIQGLLARFNLNARVYVVTVPPPAECAEFQRWPRLISSKPLDGEKARTAYT